MYISNPELQHSCVLLLLLLLELQACGTRKCRSKWKLHIPCLLGVYAVAAGCQPQSLEMQVPPWLQQLPYDAIWLAQVPLQ